MREFTDEESNFAALLQRAMDLEGVDRETIHQLVSLLMKVVQGHLEILYPFKNRSLTKNLFFNLSVHGICESG